MSEYQPEPGTWRLISPSGAEHIGDSPMRALAVEVNARVPAEVALKRIYAAIAPTLEDKAELDAHMFAVEAYAQAVAGEQSSGLVPAGVVDARRAGVRSSALKLMGLQDE